MGNYIDITGQRFGAWTVIGRAPNRYRQTTWLCRCDCGVERGVVSVTLRNKQTASCGCLKNAAISAAKRTHGHAGGSGKFASRTYRIWSAMLSRTVGKSAMGRTGYKDRGITVCDRWRDFSNFLADMGESPDGLSIDRINNDGNYEPGNCRWASDFEQAQNKRPSKLHPLRISFLRELEGMGGSARSRSLSECTRGMDSARRLCRHKGFVTYADGVWELTNLGSEFLKRTSL